MLSLQGKKILLGISGSIAAYKSLELIRLLQEQQAEIKVILTAGACEFVTPLSFSAINKGNVFTAKQHGEDGMNHIHLAKWADLILLAPSSANLIARLTYGLADDLLSMLCLASTAPIAVAPAMNQAMWLNTTTQYNIKKLKQRGVMIWGPDQGIQACGDIGPGRLLEPEIILTHLKQYFTPKLLQNCKILITAGGTQEAIDPVRYIGNRSSGKMGYCLAEAAIAMGATVTLISTKAALTAPDNAQIVYVNTALEMHAAVMRHIKQQDIFISTAAVADYRPLLTAEHKIKKHNEKMTVQLIKNPDILREVSQLSKRPLLVGFAAETENLLDNAIAKLQHKNLDFIAANLVNQNQGFNSDYNHLFLISNNETYDLGNDTKTALAYKMLDIISQFYAKQTPFEKTVTTEL